eukprot:TRINITY_DN80607_c0_g1_i1.p2 TRINITY_DN80607_c0_g1~~TRINITY_DN80607_c0_g1_i1.p2  ORF type:complete len:121 (+),score=19.31 TRINITY_DN80607_c0_g1_i1:94-456(+)
MISATSFSAVRSPVLPARSLAPIRKVTVASVSKQTTSTQNVVKQTASAALIAGPVLGATLPALAVVDERLNGDGVGYSLGINDPVLFWAILGAFSLVWILYFISQPDLGGDEDDQAGMSL